MSVESAIDYIKRMRSDDAFRRAVNEFDGSDAGWTFVKQAGYEFTMDEFRKAQEAIYAEYGITPM